MQECILELGGTNQVIFFNIWIFIKNKQKLKVFCEIWDRTFLSDELIWPAEHWWLINVEINLWVSGGWPCLGASDVSDGFNKIG